MFVAENSLPEGQVSFSMDTGRYLASSRFGILDGTGDRHHQGYVEMSPEHIAADPNLSVSCKEHLATRGYTIELNLLLRVLADCSTVPWVRTLSSGYRRWWIGSLLDWVQRTNLLSAGDYAEYEILFLKVLRGWDCGARLSGVQVQLSDLDFHIIPKFENGSGRLGVWTREEVGVFVQCTRCILSLNPQFGVTPIWESTSTSAADEAEWNDWVHQMLYQLLVIEGLGYSTPNMVSTIDDG